MNYWITTDTHFGHSNLIKYCARPEGFEDIILRKLKNTLKPGDILIHLGDFCIGNDIEWHKEFMGLGPFKKWLLKGNHDRKSNTFYNAHGWDFVGDGIVLEVFGLKILLTHRPQEGDWFNVNIHGHCHNNKRDDKLINDDKHKLILLEHHYSPQTLRQIVGR